ncbi:probable phospholipase C (plcA) [Aromatoleum aromaticum EbN1]|uniref:Probable phospholipase C (PlcA) n=1 Tax=Aromatoleum aromaticum (strain DSM 19018 / LMG 30748 / EbN1) TaxID=76114 RepID=Q5P5L3_AROAE|nr:cupin domain-containing protein [Aromatoleum aromaticum]CAI07399.1 probable phospholipase C (plcA) [Aromatoleum aromaticum EbN1]
MSSEPDRPAGASAAPRPAAELVAVRPDREVLTHQRLPYFLGISAATAGSKGLSMHIVVIPPGGVAQAHSHQDFETAIYVLEGRVETRYGPGLHQSVVSEAGDFLFIPPDVPHQAFNLSSTEPARAIIARNDADEQERVLPYDPAADG